MHPTQSAWHNLAVIFLIINAIFWGLFPHSTHCKLVGAMGVAKCPTHVMHVGFGIACFLGAVWIEQGNFFDSKNWD